MKRSAVVTPAKGEGATNEPNDQMLLVLAELREAMRRIEERQTQTDTRITEELRATTEGMRRIEERQAQADARMMSFEDKLIDIRAIVASGGRQPISLSLSEDGSKNTAALSSYAKTKKEEAAAIAEELYSYHSSNHKSNLLLVDNMMEEKAEFFDPINKICPSFNILLSHVMVNKFGVSVKSVQHTIKIGNWNERKAMRVGSSLAVFLRKRKTGDAALDAWRRHYVQLKKLFDEAEGCEEFMLVFANNLLQDR